MVDEEGDDLRIAFDGVLADDESETVMHNTNDAFFLGGVDKSLILGILKPHIFFDDQSRHLDSTSSVAPSVHIPFGVKNKLTGQ